NRRGELYKPERKTTKTNSYAEARKMATNIYDSWDPKNQRIAELEAKKERTEITIETAVLKYLADCEERLGGRNATWKTYSQLLGGSDITGVSHSLLNWLAKHNAPLSQKDKIMRVSQITSDLISEWRQSWKM